MISLQGKKVLLFPVETAVREFDFRLALAIQCADPGHVTFIGHHSNVYELGQRFRDGVYVGKNLHNTSPTRVTSCYEELKQRGFTVVYLHEEGGVFQGDLARWKHELIRRLQPGWLREDDFLCTWGELQAGIYRELDPPYKENIHVTGHPRFDLARSKYQPFYREAADEIRKTYGRFILFNTNNGKATRMKGKGYFLRPPLTAPDDIEKRRYYLDYFVSDSRRAAEMIRLVHELRVKFPDLQVVLRPHPSEDAGFYTDILDTIPGTHVERRFDLYAWLQACEFLVHSGCTTSIEAQIGGIKVLSYNSQPNSPFNKRIPNSLGIVAHNVEEALAGAQTLLDCEGQPASSPEAVREATRLFANVDPDFDSIARMGEVVRTALARVPAATQVGSLGPTVRRGRVEDLKTAFRRVAPEWMHFRSTSNSYTQQKLPHFDYREICGKLERLSGIFRKPFKLTPVNRSLLMLGGDD